MYCLISLRNATEWKKWNYNDDYNDIDNYNDDVKNVCNDDDDDDDDQSDNVASPQTSVGVRLSRIHFSRNECVTNEP